MSYATRPTSSFRQPSLGNSSNTAQSALTSRIAAKRAELENLKQLRDLSAGLATQMGMLEQKLSTLKNGTESVACILANWDNVLRAISMASSKCIYAWERAKVADKVTAKVPKPTEDSNSQVPVTLVRIPVQKAENGNG